MGTRASACHAWVAHEINGEGQHKYTSKYIIILTIHSLTGQDYVNWDPSGA